MIKLTGVYKNFKETEIYKNINYTFKNKKLTCFYGASGSGKTTLLNLMAGFDTDYAGDIEVNGVILNTLNKDKLCKYRFNNIGFVFQDYNLLKGYTVLENVIMGIELNTKISEEEKIMRSSKLLLSLGLKDNMNQMVETLSGGQKQRVSIARALVNDPQIILADEPTGALDEESKDNIMDILKEISRDKTVVVITHDEQVLSYADEVIELKDFNLHVRELDKELYENGASKNKIMNCKDIGIWKNKYSKNLIKKANKSLNENVGIDKYSISTKLLKNEGSEVACEKSSFLNQNEPKLNGKALRKISIKNFKIHLFKYAIAAFIIALGTAAFVSTFSFKGLTNNIIEDFKSKNFFYNIAQINVSESKGNPKEILSELESSGKIEGVYNQYNLENLEIEYGEKKVQIPMKTPTVISKESMAYGNMPKKGEHEIALPLNIVNGLVDDVKSILDKKIKLQYIDKEGDNKTISLNVSGITNSQYQDFIVSSDVEKNIYDLIDLDHKKESFIAFNIKEFEDISSINETLKEKGMAIFTKAEAVDSFVKSFKGLVTLYTVVSYLILVVGILISIVILLRIISQRYREVGLLGALGYTNRNIRKILFAESIYFALISIPISFLLLYGIRYIYQLNFEYLLPLNMWSFIIIVLLNVVLTIAISYFLNNKLISIEPAKALRK